VFSKFEYEITPPRTISSPPFNIEIERLILEKRAIGACDASVEDGMMGGYWMIMTEDKRILIEKEIYSKR